LNKKVRQEELSTVESWIVYLRDAGIGRGADDAWGWLGNESHVTNTDFKTSTAFPLTRVAIELLSPQDTLSATSRESWAARFIPSNSKMASKALPSRGGPDGKAVATGPPNQT
jgi:hypothetical protein